MPYTIYTVEAFPGARETYQTGSSETAERASRAGCRVTAETKGRADA